MIRTPSTLLACTALLILGCGGSDSDAPAPKKADGAAATTSPAPPPPTASEAVGAIDPAAKATYDARCLMCHGATGAGDGSMVAMLKVKPRSFGSDAWRFVDFAAGDAAVRAETRRVIREGIADAMMPPAAATDTDAQLDALVDYVLLLRRQMRDG